MEKRSVVIDAVRGVLVLLMIVYHAVYVAAMYRFIEPDLYSGFWWLFPRSIAAGFLVVSGWNLAAKKQRGAPFRSFLLRAARLAPVALAISIGTWPVLGKSFVFFGIIHLLTLSSIIAWPIAGRPVLAGVVAIVSFVTGLAIGGYRAPYVWLAWLGVRPAGLYPADYEPLLPWFGFVALGMVLFHVAGTKAVGHAAGARFPVQPSGKPDAQTAPAGGLHSVAIHLLAATGKRSLPLYLIHLPLLYGLGWLIAHFDTLLK